MKNFNLFYRCILLIISIECLGCKDGFQKNPQSDKNNQNCEIKGKKAREAIEREKGVSSSSTASYSYQNKTYISNRLLIVI